MIPAPFRSCSSTVISTLMSSHSSQSSAMATAHEHGGRSPPAGWSSIP